MFLHSTCISLVRTLSRAHLAANWAEAPMRHAAIPQEIKSSVGEKGGAPSASTSATLCSVSFCNSVSFFAFSPLNLRLFLGTGAPTPQGQADLHLSHSTRQHTCHGPRGLSSPSSPHTHSGTSYPAGTMSSRDLSSHPHFRSSSSCGFF